nr:MAG TPA: bifunctional HTH-domain containing protein/aminotransferase [Caudoviricetes sp.]
MSILIFNIFNFYVLSLELLFCMCYIIIRKRKENNTMEKVSSSERFKTLMNERNLRQVDILNLVLPYCKKYNVKMNKSDISQYVSGKTEPSQEKLVVLGMALNVSESWLMGFNVGRERKDTPEKAREDFDFLSKFSLLTERDQKIVLSLINSMLSTK